MNRYQWHKMNRFRKYPKTLLAQFEPKSLALLLRNHWHYLNRISQELTICCLSNKTNKPTL